MRARVRWGCARLLTLREGGDPAGTGRRRRPAGRGQAAGGRDPRVTSEVLRTLHLPIENTGLSRLAGAQTRAKAFGKRRRIFKEIIETEKYVTDMALVCDAFHMQLLDQQLINETRLGHLLNLPSIRDANSTLLAVLQRSLLKDGRLTNVRSRFHPTRHYSVALLRLYSEIRRVIICFAGKASK